jgi:dihydrodipicolinate synthase/N-acetylneuraminate lyase
MTLPTVAKRYPSVIMGTCVVPWTETLAFDERAFRAQVRDLAGALTRHLYVFGTAGEGYAVTESQFEKISRAFLEESAAGGVEAMVGIISLSLPTIVERIERARGWGARRFQLSLPSWGALNDRELEAFFRETCDRFSDCEFMHYNLQRTKRLVTPAEYARFAEEHSNLVGTKNTRDDEVFLTELLTLAPQLQHFLGESGYMRMRDRFECGLLISLAAIHADRAQTFFAARGDLLQQMNQQLRPALTALKEAVGSEAHIDGAYDKLIYKLRAPSFPLRLLPPYNSADEQTALDRFRDGLDRLAPTWVAGRNPG